MTEAGTATRFVAAITDQRLAALADELLLDAGTDPDTRALAERARAACRRIAERAARERDDVVASLGAAGIGAAPSPLPDAMQHHTIELRIADADTAARAATALAADGFEPWERWVERSAGAERSFRHHASARTVVRVTDVTVVVRLRWADRAQRTVAQRLVSPTAADWHAVALPAAAWRGYSVVRPIRLLAERVGLRSRHEGGLGPFLTTPDELIDDLLAVADVSRHDVVADLGCGDGRLVVGAAVGHGCRARGIEHDPALADRARDRARAAGVTSLVDIVVGDARAADLRDVTVALVFLPTDVAADLLPDLLDRLAPGARLLLHEQRPLPPGLPRPPNVSLPVIGAAAVTVAHRWDVPTT